MLTNKVGIYIHIPFCKRKCDYCDFYSLPLREDAMASYQKALMAHLKETGPFARGYQVDSVYFGGGTPSYYGAKYLEELLGAVRRNFQVSRDAEITVEANPESVEEKDLRRLRRAGVNRLSLGVQSACEEELAAVGRLHTFAQAVRAVEAARRAKLENVSLDVIYGLPGQDMASWKRTLEAVLELEPRHISAYGLKLEEGTPLCRRAEEGEPLPDDDDQADLYLCLVERMEQAGLKQYEISNFARNGYQSRHNLKYWMGRPYLGFGPGAHSDFSGRRYSYKRDLDGYIRGVLGGGSIMEECAEIPRKERSGEYLMLRMRTLRGIEEWEYRREFYLDFDPIEEALLSFERQGWAVKEDGRWHFTPRGFLVSNRLIGELLEAQERAFQPGGGDQGIKGNPS